MRYKGMTWALQVPGSVNPDRFAVVSSMAYYCFGESIYSKWVRRIFADPDQAHAFALRMTTDSELRGGVLAEGPATFLTSIHAIRKVLLTAEVIGLDAEKALSRASGIIPSVTVDAGSRGNREH